MRIMMPVCALWSLKDMVTITFTADIFLKWPLICQSCHFWANYCCKEEEMVDISDVSFSFHLVFLSACFCCQRALWFARQSVLCQCGLACVMQEGRNLGAPCVLLRSDQYRLSQTSVVCCGDSPSLCFDVWSQLQFPVLHHSHKNVRSKTKPRDESRPWISPRTQTRRQNPNITGFSNRSAGKISLLSENMNKVHFSDKTVFLKQSKEWQTLELKRKWVNSAVVRVSDHHIWQCQDCILIYIAFTFYAVFSLLCTIVHQAVCMKYLSNYAIALCIGLYN